MKKIGILCLALVLAVGSLGIGYAAWTDTLTIDGTVNTGTVDIDLYELSSTLVYKDLDTDLAVVVHQRKNLRDLGGGIGWSVVNVPPIPSNGLLVASAIATLGGGDPDVVFTWTNIFPSIDFTADVVWHYNGSIPAKVNDIDWGLASGSEWLAPYTTLSMVIIDSLDAGRIDDIVDEGYQLHYSDEILLEVTIHLPQDNDLMDKTASGWLNIEVVQWNEYPHTP
jgi:predicted ribosomally synthesized peptide with SipW-like signal peptide